MVENLLDILKLLYSPLKLDREKGISELEKLLQSDASIDRSSLLSNFLKMISDHNCSWEVKHGALCGTKAIISIFRHDLNEDDREFIEKFETEVIKLLSDSELRVRMEAGELFARIIFATGADSYLRCKSELFALIENSDSSILETTLKTLKLVIDGCGDSFAPYLDCQLVNSTLKCLGHSNRFVRAAAFHVCSSIINSDSSESNPIFSSSALLCDLIADGLSDTWSEVRLAASSTSRLFLLVLDESSRHNYFPKLLPRLCFNRYYVAEGVRTYSQETWRQITGHCGKDLVEQHIDATVDYYETASQSENYEDKETSCNCISELVSKLDGEVVRPHVMRLLKILLICCEDNYWTVRDAACLALGTFVAFYPEESFSLLDNLTVVLFANLGDPISILRQSSATSLASFVRVYGDPVLDKIISFIKTSLKNIGNTELVEMDNNIKVASNMIRKLPKRRHSVSRLTVVDYNEDFGNINFSPMGKSQPWEIADGCIYLVGELSAIPNANNVIIFLVDAIKDAAGVKSYAEHLLFLENLCKQLPVIAKNLGKRSFKSIAEHFFDAIFYSLDCENSLTSSAASQCLNQLAAILGSSILREKINSYNYKYLEKFESVLHVAAF